MFKNKNIWFQIINDIEKIIEKWNLKPEHILELSEDLRIIAKVEGIKLS